MKAFEFDHRLVDSYARFSRFFSTIRSDEGRPEFSPSLSEQAHSDLIAPGIPK